jgi:hypothetical protein
MGKDMGATTAQHGEQAMGWMSELGPFLPGRGVCVCVEIFTFSNASRLTLRPSHPPFQPAPMSLSLEVERPVREADHQPLSSATLTTRQLYLNSLSYHRRIVHPSYLSRTGGSPRRYGSRDEPPSGTGV